MTHSSGFTLVETVMVVALTALASVTLGTLISYFYKTNSYTLQASIAVGQARSGVEEAMTRLREASYGSDGSYPIASTATSSITFYANVDNSSAIERVTYRLLSGILYRVVATPVGSPLTYTGATLATTTIAMSVTNGTSTAMFRYFDSAGTELTSPINISRISSVRTTVIVDVDTRRAPVPFTLTGGATLRNLLNEL